MPISWTRIGIALLLTLGPLGCASPATPSSAGSVGSDASSGPADFSAGQAVYEHPLSDGNTFACATCHALEEPSPDGLRRPGHPIGDATRRTRWKNGKAPTFFDAVNSCVTEWMIAPAWTPAEPRFVALRAFLDSKAKVDPAPDVTFEIVPPPADLSGGDATRGRATFNETCVVCHGMDAVGTQRAPRISNSTRATDYIAQRIRTSGSKMSAIYPGLTGGVMPFWAKDRLSDDEVRDLVAFVHTPRDAGTSPGNPGGDGGALDDGGALEGGSAADAPPESGSGCPKTNPRVGWVADLGVNTGEGQVSGMVTMIDDCTLELTNFSYNGDGIDVRVYGSKAKSFNPGFSIGPDIVGKVFTSATLSVTLPAGKTLDDLDYVAIWCVQAKANFGSGPFAHP